MKKLVFAVALSCALAIDPANAKKEPELSGLALQQIQSHDFEAPYDIVFASVMSTLQDTGYVIEAAGKDTGLITARGESGSKMTYNIFWGLGRKTKTPRVSATLDNRAPNLTRVRLNFVIVEGKSAGYGINAEGGRMITDRAVYQDAFEKIEQAVFVRMAMDAPAPAAVAPTVPAEQPAAVTPPTVVAEPTAATPVSAEAPK